MVTPESAPKPAPEPQAEKPTAAADEKITISRRDRQPDIEDSIETESAGAEETAEVAHEDEDGLRVIPGARGRRRDRARKSRLDEDFEKIFDDEGKPSINSLRRKLRSGAAEGADGENELLDEAGQAVGTTEDFSAEQDEPKQGFFSRLLKRNKVEKPELDDVDEEELVAAFEADRAKDNTPVFKKSKREVAEDDVWQDAAETTRKQNQIALPIIGAGAAILLGGLAWFAYKFFFAG